MLQPKQTRTSRDGRAGEGGEVGESAAADAKLSGFHRAIQRSSRLLARFAIHCHDPRTRRHLTHVEKGPSRSSRSPKASHYYYCRARSEVDSTCGDRPRWHALLALQIASGDGCMGGVCRGDVIAPNPCCIARNRSGRCQMETSKD